MHAGSGRGARDAARGRGNRASGCERTRSRVGGGTGGAGVECALEGDSDGGGGTEEDSACGKTEGGGGASGPGSRRRPHGPCGADWRGAGCERLVLGGRGGRIGEAERATCPAWCRIESPGEKRSWGWTAGGRGSRGWKWLDAVCGGC